MNQVFVMKTHLYLVLGLVMMPASAVSAGQPAEKPTPASVKAITKKVADWQLETYADMGKFRALTPGHRGRENSRGPHEDTDWTCVTLHLGLYHLGQTINEPRYIDWVRAISEKSEWKMQRLRQWDRLEEHGMGLIYLKLYEQTPDPTMIADVQE